MKKLILPVALLSLAVAGCSGTDNGVANTAPLKSESQLPQDMPPQAAAQARGAMAQSQAMRAQMEKENQARMAAQRGQ